MQTSQDRLYVITAYFNPKTQREEFEVDASRRRQEWLTKKFDARVVFLKERDFLSA